MPTYLAALSLPQAVRELKRMNYPGEGWTPLQEGFREGIQQILQDQLLQERGAYLSGMAARGEADRSNGYYPRRLLSSMGELELKIPRTRTFNATGALQAYSRRVHEVDRLILACFVFGLSTRKVGEALLPILGLRVSASTVSRIAKSLDQAVRGFHQRRLSDRYRVVLLDGVVLSRRTGAGALKRPVLVALGITREGKKEILDFRVVTSESQANWEAFLFDLRARGLTGKKLEMIVTDGGSGLRAALPMAYPHVPEQLCWAHKTRNVLDKMPKSDREQARQGLQSISHAEDLRSARGAAQAFVRHWEERAPRAVRCLRKDLEDLVVFFHFREEKWRRASRTTNAIERRFREVKRRTRPMGAFFDRTSMERILFSVFSHENTKQGTATPFPMTQDS